MIRHIAPRIIVILLHLHKNYYNYLDMLDSCMIMVYTESTIKIWRYQLC